MKRVLAGGVAVALALVMVAPAQAELVGVGFSAYGGWEFPVGQDDASDGVTYGLRVPIQIIPMLRFEPWVGRIDLGEYEIDGIGGPFKFDGGSITSYAVNVVLGSPITAPSIGIAFVAGIGKHQWKVDDVEQYNRIGYNVGLDLSLPLGSLPLSVNARGEVLIVPLEDSGSRKYALVTIGAIYKVEL